MAPVPGTGPTWIFGSMVLNDRDGNERMLAKYEKIRPPLQAYERGLVLFNDEKQQFEPFVKFDLKCPVVSFRSKFIRQSRIAKRR